MSTRRRYVQTYEWQQLRLAVLLRDGYQCQIKGEKCTGRATTVDHVEPIAEGGAPYDPSNLRAACKPCNFSLGGKLGRQRQAAKITALEAEVASLRAQLAAIREADEAAVY